MNKLRLIRIYELKGKVHPLEASIIDLLDGIEEEPHRDYIFYKKDGKTHFAYYLLTKNIWIYLPIFKNFKCSSKETKEIMKYLLEKHLKLEINMMR